jgi:non-homologous end joining protein Ku
MDAMDDETRRRLEEEIVELQAKLDEAKKKTFSSQKERDKVLNRIGQAIRNRRNEIKNPGLATKQRREHRRQKAMNSKNNSNHAHHGLDSSLASSVSHIAAAAKQARAGRT